MRWDTSRGKSLTSCFFLSVTGRLIDVPSTTPPGPYRQSSCARRQTSRRIPERGHDSSILPFPWAGSPTQGRGRRGRTIASFPRPADDVGGPGFGTDCVRHRPDLRNIPKNSVIVCCRVEGLIFHCQRLTRHVHDKGARVAVGRHEVFPFGWKNESVGMAWNVMLCMLWM